MAGHSKWANIKHRKAAQDSVRSKLFAKFSKEIMVAAKNGPDPTTNNALRLAIAKAKAKSMPSKNIEKAINKSKNEKNSATFSVINYEAFLSGGISIIIECLTDNHLRAGSNVRAILKKNGGELQKNGSVSYLFERNGVLEIDKTFTEDEVYEATFEYIKNIKETETTFLITTKYQNFNNAKEELDKLGVTKFYTAELKMEPLDLVELSEEKTIKILALIDKLLNDDDVQNVYHNLKI